MKLCTCPRIATARGLLPTGDIDARCPVHRVPDPQPERIMSKPAPAPRPAFEGVRYCEECGRQHAAVRCDFVDEN
jgi:hypothetical protein